MADTVPTDKGSKEATFRSLVDDFKLDERVYGLFIASPMDTLEDLRFYFAEEKEIDAFVAEAKELKDHALRIQVARMRRAWFAVRQTALRKEARNSTSTAAELDDLLDEADLRNVKINFWKRYKLRYPAEIMPCDQLVSRCYREVEKRLLTVYDMWKVRSLMHQVTSSKKRKQVGDGLYTFEEEAQAPLQFSAATYLMHLHTYLLALAITGSVKKSGAPAEETMGSDPTQFVDAPWDALEEYYFRAVRSAAAIPEASRLAWLERTDMAERAVWVSTFREGETTIGEVIKQTMDRRGAHWDPPAAPRAIIPQQHGIEAQGDRKRGRDQPRKQRDRSRRRGRSQEKKEAWHRPGTVVLEVNGKKLCPDFQKGNCRTKGPSCQKGLHRCGKVGKRGKVCGMNFHGAKNCKTK